VNSLSNYCCSPSSQPLENMHASEAFAIFKREDCKFLGDDFEGFETFHTLVAEMVHKDPCCECLKQPLL